MTVRWTRTGRFRLFLAAVAVTAAAGCGGGGGGGGAAASRDVGAGMGPPLAAESGLPVTFSSRTFVDRTRSTPAQGDAPEQPSRTLITTVATPDGPGPFPLIIFSHGFGGSGEDYADVLRAIASAGYVVAAPDFPLTSAGAPGGPQRGVDAPEAQPGDVRFVIDELLRLNGDPADALSARIDPRRIGAAGHSMGAGITMGVAYNSCCRDVRIRAGVLMAVDPPTQYHGDYFVPPVVPVLVIHGGQDEALPYQGGRRAYADAEPPKFFLTVLGGDHNWPYSAAAQPEGASVVMAATVDFFDAYLKGRADGLSRLRADADRPGVTKFENVVR
ncbi:MAG: dienelactone hydrolase family protein [Actinomycetota bacterium]|nr:dienelactone hydrolase family protein [Actinomycetota bacterium]